MCFPGPFSSGFSRRRFLAYLGAAGVVSVSGKASNALALSGGKFSPSEENKTSAAPLKNRAPLAPNAFYTLPLGSIRPTGWLRDQLLIQARGLSGHLDETWPDVGPNSGWLGGTGESWERGPYFLDGLVPLAYLLDDERLKAKAQKYLDWTLNNTAPNGMIGPKSNDDWWPRMVMLKALTQYHEATADPASSLSCRSTSPISAKQCPGVRFAIGENIAGTMRHFPSSGSITAQEKRGCSISSKCCSNRDTTGRPNLPTSNTHSAQRRNPFTSPPALR